MGTKVKSNQHSEATTEGSKLSKSDTTLWGKCIKEKE